MFVGHMDEAERIFMNVPGAAGASKQVLLGADEGWEDHVMRVINLEGLGHSPKHQHPWPHINFVVEGEGQIEIAGKTTNVKPGSTAYIPADVEHQYRSTSASGMRFICIVPTEGDK